MWKLNSLRFVQISHSFLPSADLSTALGSQREPSFTSHSLGFQLEMTRYRKARKRQWEGKKTGCFLQKIRNENGVPCHLRGSAFSTEMWKKILHLQLHLNFTLRHFSAQIKIQYTFTFPTHPESSQISSKFRSSVPKASVGLHSFRSQMLFLKPAGVILPIWGSQPQIFQLPPFTFTVHMFSSLSLLIFLNILLFYLPGVAMTWDFHIKHHSCWYDTR